MAFVNTTTLGETERDGFKASLKRVESTSKDSNTVRTDFEDVSPGEHLIYINEIDHHGTVMVDADTILDLFDVFEFTEDQSDLVNVEVNGVDWYENVNKFKEIKDYKNRECVVCGDYGKRTTELLGPVPDREEYTNGWTHPIVKYGWHGSHFHEDCLSLIVTLSYELYMDNKEEFMAITV